MLEPEELAVVAQRDRALDLVLQLAHVARE
jgi:hypothetical protein